MIKKFIFVPLIILIISGCGYTPQYSSKNFTNFIIVIEKYNGPNEFNNQINTQLKRYEKNTKAENIKIFKLEYNSNVDKNTTSKDITGNSTEYQLLAKIDFIIKNEVEIIEFTLKESFKYDKISDLVAENEYEKTILKNMANSLVNKLIFKLNRLNLDDN